MDRGHGVLNVRSGRAVCGAIVVGLVSLVLAVPVSANAAANCGTSAGDTICVTAPDGALAGTVTIGVTRSPNSGTLVVTWAPSGGSATTLLTEFAPSPATNDYSFAWPTQKYLDASGVLRVYANSTNSTPVTLGMTLANGNTSTFQHSPSDWQSFLPNPTWTAPADPLVIAVGDGASNEQAANENAGAIAAADPALFLYLGDIYDTGTFTENLNHYGQNSMDGGPGSLWGAMGTFTQPAMGDHEAANVVAWRDYFHQRPNYTSFRFANVLFFDLSSAADAMTKGSAQYNYVQSVLNDVNNPPPPCIVTYFQNPAINKKGIQSKRLAMWTLLTDNGGDLVFVGNSHNMSQYKPLNDQLAIPSQGDATMIEMISGAGGHAMAAAFPSDPKLEWSKGKTAGAVYMTLDHARDGGTPTSLSWSYQDTKANVLHTGTRDCGAGPSPSGPVVSGFSPTSGSVGTSVTITGSGFTGATDVSFDGVSVGAGNFAVDTDAQITAIVPQGATSGPISVVVGTTATSSTSFTVTGSGAVLTFTPDADTYVESDTPTANYGLKPAIKVDNSPVKTGLLRFTVSGVGAGSVATAVLRVYCTDASTDGGTLYSVSDNTWGESTVNWNTAPAPGSALGSLGVVTAGAWSSVDVTPFVTGDGTYSVEIAKSTANAAFFSTKEGTPGFAAQLVVTLT
jgi:IPT/TIG domain